MDTITLYNIVHNNWGITVTIDREVPREDIKEIIRPETKDEYNEYGQLGCYKVYLYSDNVMHYGNARALDGKSKWFEW